METQKSLNIIAKGAVVIILSFFLSKVLGYFYRLIIARTGPDLYGIFSLGLAIYGVLLAISSLGLHEGVFRFVPHFFQKKDHQRLKGVITSSIKISVISSVSVAFILFILSDFISIKIFNKPQLSIVLKVLSFVLPLETISELFLNSLKGFKKVKYFAFSKNIFEKIAKVGFTILFIVLGYGLFGVSIAYGISILSTLILGYYILNKKVFNLVNKKIISISNKKELLSYSIPLTFNSILSLLMLWTDTIILGYFKESSEVGVYNAALPTAQLMYIFPYSLFVILVPVLLEYHIKEDKVAFKNIYKTITKWVFLLNLLLFLIFVVFSKQILFILFKDPYASASSALIILAIGYLIFYTISSSREVLLILKKTKIILFNTITAASLNIVLNIILIPSYGLNGAAIATSVSFTFMSMLLIIESYIYVKIIPIKLNYMRIMLSAFLAIFPIYFITKKFNIGNNIFYILLLIILLLSLYFAFLLITHSLEKEDINLLNSVKNKIKLRTNYFFKD